MIVEERYFMLNSLNSSLIKDLICSKLSCVCKSVITHAHFFIQQIEKHFSLHPLIIVNWSGAHQTKIFDDGIVLKFRLKD